MATDTDKLRVNRVKTLEEVVVLLKKHVQQREMEINVLGKQLKASKDRIKSLERQVHDPDSVRHLATICENFSHCESFSNALTVTHPLSSNLLFFQILLH